MRNRRHIIDEWNRLAGFEVDVLQHGRVVRSGTVTDVAIDSSALWIAADGVDGRMLIHRGEGYAIGIDDRHLARLQMRDEAAKAAPSGDSIPRRHLRSPG